MNVLSREKIVLLGLMSHMPVAGVAWVTVQYLVGFQRLGYDVYYIEAHGCTPRELMQCKEDDGWEKAAAYIDGVMGRFGLGGRWAYHAVYHGNRCYGMSEARLRELYRSAALIINLHGGTVPLPEHYATGRLVYLETDPVELQMQLHENRQDAIDFLEPHGAFFTFGENYSNHDCGLPISDRFRFQPTRQPVVLDLWQTHGNDAGDALTTIGNWRQPYRKVVFNGEVYHWSKHYEFLKFLDLPRRTGQAFELALSSFENSDRAMLEGHGWRVRPAAALSDDIDCYRRYIVDSRGEFTVAKDQNVRLRSGWFSDRSATYLAAGRPVITQETGFSNVLPTGRGLFAFSTLEDAVLAVEQINTDYPAHAHAAREVAKEYFAAERVLGRLLERVGL